MPALQNKGTILITGASGYLAVHVVEAFLNDGFSVRGTVRSSAKGDYLVNQYKDKPFEYVIVPDMQTDDAFDEAVKGVVGVAHVASPVKFPQGDPEENAIKPAVRGTLNILESAKKYGYVRVVDVDWRMEIDKQNSRTDVKRVIITGSVNSVAGGLFAAGNETNWNDEAVVAFKEKANPEWFETYSASKVYAERAAWEWVQKNEVGFDITVLLPSVILGPSRNQVNSPADLHSALYLVLSGIAPEKVGKEATNAFLNYIDSRDAAKIHVLAMITEAAGNQRLLTTAGNFSFQDVYDSLQESPAFAGYPIGPSPGATRGKEWEAVYSQEKLQRILGKDKKELFRPLSDTIRDMVADAEAKGWFLNYVPPYVGVSV